MNYVNASYKKYPYRNWAGVVLGTITVVRRLGSVRIDRDRTCALWECVCQCGRVVKLDTAALSKKQRGLVKGARVFCSNPCGVRRGTLYENVGPPAERET